MKAANRAAGLNRILKFILILALVVAMIPAMPGEAASTKSKAMAAFKKKLSASTVTVLPKGKKVINLNDKKVTYKSSKTKNVKFAIAYIDNNNVPELILEDPFYGYGVWAYKGGKVTCVLWGDSYCKTYGYYKKKGIYEDITYSEGSPFTKSFYQYKNGKMTERLSKFVHQEGRPEADYSFHNPYKEVSKAAFKKRLNSYVGKTAVTKLYPVKNTSKNRKKYLK